MDSTRAPDEDQVMLARAEDKAGLEVKVKVDRPEGCEVEMGVGVPEVLVTQMTMSIDVATRGTMMAGSPVESHAGARPLAAEIRRKSEEAAITDCNNAPAPFAKRAGATTVLGSRQGRQGRVGVSGTYASGVDRLQGCPCSGARIGEKVAARAGMPTV